MSKDKIDQMFLMYCTNLSLARRSNFAIFSENMAQPIKLNTSGKDTCALPVLTAITGIRSDGTLVPRKQRITPNSKKNMDNSPNQTILNDLPGRGGKRMRWKHLMVLLLLVR